MPSVSRTYKTRTPLVAFSSATFCGRAGPGRRSFCQTVIKTHMRSERLHTYDFDMKMCTSMCSPWSEAASRISFGKNNKQGIWCENHSKS